MASLPTEDRRYFNRVLELFSTELKGVQFPGLDEEVLASAAESVSDAAENLARIEGQRAEALHRLEQAEEALLYKAQRFVSYARVYAEEHPALHEKLDALDLPRPSRRKSETDVLATPSETKNRRPRTKSNETSLFHDDPDVQALEGTIPQ